jgi:hypothetical protein
MRAEPPANTPNVAPEIASAATDLRKRFMIGSPLGSFMFDTKEMVQTR